MLIPVVLSGGAGTRLWPVSREGQPKPFMRLPDGQTLLGKTYRRAAGLLAGHGEIVTVTNREHYFQSKDQFQAARLGRHRGHFILEPTDATPLRRLPSPPWRCKPNMATRRYWW
ncbi:phosphomannose isomerase/GDP-mannose WbpW [Pseudomonas aeruginosa]|nr:phosphomannose isomerase/GDP-mannose WbpW [Pseudomonas aeruginosa]